MAFNQVRNITPPSDGIFLNSGHDIEHEGPLTWNDVQTRLNAHLISLKTFVWFEGLDTWITLGDIHTATPTHPTVPIEQTTPNIPMNSPTQFKNEIELSDIPEVQPQDESTFDDSFDTPPPKEIKIKSTFIPNIIHYVKDNTITIIRSIMLVGVAFIFLWALYHRVYVRSEFEVFWENPFGYFLE